MFTIGGVSFNLTLVFLVIISTIVPMLDYYNHTVSNTREYSRFALYFILPVIIILLLFREPLSAYGFTLGKWKAGLIWTVGTAVIMALILTIVARTPAMQTYYQARAPKGLNRLIYLTGVELFAWEFMWRGFILFGLARIIGPGPAILFQAIPFAFMHLGKPEVETLSTIFGGIGFGFVAWQTESFLYPFLIHWFIASFTILAAR